MLTAKEFAAETGISYPIIIRWLKEEKIPGAAFQQQFGVWQIPASAVPKFSKEENKPKRGWKKGRKRGAQTEAKTATGDNK